ncbi:uncharacterized protein I303_107612 [Kwoniella dejecticola CBS 10117]|uniref:Uncharacterized protein n=1 Tax=Kwoniella dejecticola CBS 10117 TaxID=1296121 RepID=A0A1A5ZV85_9TREE|nr:uncharacterized protein I303_07623 [Kwoniella dejecticola CBS 10117]OBR81713.1 hypothetical protein I303_07623 [Kwoniella dejecticola CBS 10117]
MSSPAQTYTEGSVVNGHILRNGQWVLYSPGSPPGLTDASTISSPASRLGVQTRSPSQARDTRSPSQASSAASSSQAGTTYSLSRAADGQHQMTIIFEDHETEAGETVDPILYPSDPRQ